MPIEVRQINYEPPLDVFGLYQQYPGGKKRSIWPWRREKPLRPVAIEDETKHERTILGIGSEDGSATVFRRDKYSTYTPRSAYYEVTPPTLDGIARYLLFVYTNYAVLLKNPKLEDLEKEHELKPDELEQELTEHKDNLASGILAIRPGYESQVILAPLDDPQRRGFEGVLSSFIIRRSRNGDDGHSPIPSTPKELSHSK